MSNDNKEMSEEDYLKYHLSDMDKGNNNEFSGTDIQNNDIFDNTIEDTATTVNDLQFFNFSVDQLPCGRFYPRGTLLMVRPAQVKEIQAFSMVDDNNFQDIIEKMNYMLQTCVRIKYTDGSVGSFLELKDQDRLYVIYLIRELTFQKGNELTVKAKCPADDSEVIIPMRRENFVFHKLDEKLEKYFNPNSGSFKFKLKNSKEYEITPPNIGIQKSFTEYIIEEHKSGNKLNLSFLKIIPFMLGNRKSITYEGIKSKLVEYEKMDDISFQFLNSAINKMTIGIKELKTKCQCGQEIHTDMEFPNKASGIFLVQDAFESYLEE